MPPTEKDLQKRTEKDAQNPKWSGDMRGLNANPLANTPVAAMVEQLTREQCMKYFEGRNTEKLAAAFEDEELMRTFDAYLANRMNASETAKTLYMHRNTLMYRLKKLCAATGMDVRDFDSAITFAVLRLLYCRTR